MLHFIWMKSSEIDADVNTVITIKDFFFFSSFKEIWLHINILSA